MTSARRILLLLVGVGIILAPAFTAFAVEGIVIPKGIQIPVEYLPVPKVELKVPVAASFAPSACPLDASVIIHAKDASHIYVGSGTVVSNGGESTIVSCAHIIRGLSDPKVTVTHAGKDYVAEILKLDDQNDLMALLVLANLPSVDLVNIKPIINDKVTSVGVSGRDDGKLTEIEHAVTAIDKYNGPRNIETDGRQVEGRSGGGLFFNGQLCGVIQGRRNDVQRSVYVSIEPIRDILTRSTMRCESCVAEQFGAGHTDVELWLAPFHCVPCNRLKSLLGDGNDRVSIKRYVAPSNWNPGGGGFPYVRFTDMGGETHLLHGVRSMEQLEKNIAEKNAKYQTQQSASEVGAELNASGPVKLVLSKLTDIAGDGSTIELKLTRTGAKDALMISETHTRTDILGTSGRVDLTVNSANKIPVRKIGFNYRFENGKVFVKLDEMEFEIPEDGVVGGTPVPVGSPLMIAWTVLSTIQTIYEVFHPTVDVWLGPTIEMSATLKDGSLTINCGANPPAVRAHWSFWFGLLKFEYSRPLTGLVLSSDNLSLQFHKSRIYRDVNIAVK